MQVSDRGILLHKVKYGDSGLILKMYTKGHGSMSFIIQGLKGKNKSISTMMHPFAELDLVFLDKSKSELKRIKEVQIHSPFHSIRNDLNRTGLAFFLSEVLLKCLRENESNASLYSFVRNSIDLLNTTTRIGNFHLVFMLRLTQFLGCYPLGSFNGREFLDLQEGLFTRIRPVHIYYVEQQTAKHIGKIILDGYDFLDEKINGEDRNDVLEALIKYFQIHIDGFGTLKSLKVLQELND
ncbi:MAG: DNA repair protein RecO [Crocinitomicaceae bacterium]|nr:DNA repair protein RecO [Crocinitomicaceae bacterium]|tara:strand:+ start:8255 stop:8968 length:714 start_codon:yes stop_codon:yes gene_type:complete